MPDLVTTAKGIAGGLPLAAVTGRAEHHGRRPRRRARRHLRRQPGRLRRRARAPSRRCASTTSPAGPAQIGALMHAAADAPSPTKHAVRRRRPRPRRDDGRRDRRARTARSLTPPAPAAVSAYCHSQGVVTLTCGTYGNVLRFLPPLVIPTRCSTRRSTWSRRRSTPPPEFGPFSPQRRRDPYPDPVRAGEGSTGTYGAAMRVSAQRAEPDLPDGPPAVGRRRRSSWCSATSTARPPAPPCAARPSASATTTPRATGAASG